MSSRSGRVAIIALVAQRAIAWPRVDPILNARAPQLTIPPESSGSPTVTIASVTSAEASSTAYPVLPTYTPPDGSVLSCPGSDEKTFTDSTGKSYIVSCYTDFFDYVGNITYAVSLDACASVCSNMAGCVAAVWRPGSSDGPCYLKSGVGPPSNDLGLMAFLPTNDTLSTLVATSVATSTPQPGTTNVLTSEPTPIETIVSTTTSTGNMDASGISSPTGNPVMITPTGLSGLNPPITMPTIPAVVTAPDTSATPVVQSVPTTLSTAPPLITSSITPSVFTSSVDSLSTPTISNIIGSVSPIVVYTSTETTGSVTIAIPVTSTMNIIPTSALSTSSATPTPSVKIPYAPCSILNHKGNTFYLRTYVIYGNIEFENLYVQEDVYGAPPTIPSLSTSRDTAAQAVYDFSTFSIAIWHGGCTFSGLKLNRDRDMNSWSPVLVGDEVGTSKMSIAYGEVWWDNDRFGSWLICKDPDTHVYEMMWWDTITDEGIDGQRCAKVQLLTENI